MPYIACLEFKNVDERPLLVRVQPWGKDFKLKENERLEVYLASRSPDVVPLDHARHQVVVHGLPESYAEVHKAGKIIWQGEPPPAAEEPEAAE